MSRTRRVDTSSYQSFADISERLDEIVKQVRRKDIPLESSLDLFDEAIALGQKAVDFVDTDSVTNEEALRAERVAQQTDAQEAERGKRSAG